MKWHVISGHASAQQLERVLADSDRDTLRALTSVDGELGQREVCRALDGAPHAPAAGTSTVVMFNEKSVVCG